VAHTTVPGSKLPGKLKLAVTDVPLMEPDTNEGDGTEHARLVVTGAPGIGVKPACTHCGVAVKAEPHDPLPCGVSVPPLEDVHSRPQPVGGAPAVSVYSRSACCASAPVMTPRDTAPVGGCGLSRVLRLHEPPKLVPPTPVTVNV
jgi:hypothetical protein